MEWDVKTPAQPVSLIGSYDLLFKFNTNRRLYISLGLRDTATKVFQPQERIRPRLIEATAGFPLISAPYISAADVRQTDGQTGEQQRRFLPRFESGLHNKPEEQDAIQSHARLDTTRQEPSCQ